MKEKKMIEKLTDAYKRVVKLTEEKKEEKKEEKEKSRLSRY